MTSIFNKTAALIILLAAATTTLQAQVKKTTVKKKVTVSKATTKVGAGLTASMARGKVVFNNICATCHQADGLGVPRMNPPLAKTSYVLGDKGKLISIVLNGFSEDVEINGERYSNVMPSHDYLQDQQIADVLTYVRNSFGNKASAVTVAEVKKGRAAKK
jgi:mono/diheme cytochrome c family protein